MVTRTGRTGRRTELDTWEITDKGLEVANAILARFVTTTDDIELIARDFGLTAEEARVIIMIAEAGGIVNVGSDDE